MKHTLRITIIMLLMFLIVQFIGIGILYKYIDQEQSSKEGKVVFKELPIGERPPLGEKTSYIPVILAILVGTGIFLLLIKLHWVWVMRIWFLLAVVFALTITFGSFLSVGISFMLAIILGLWKLFKPSFLIHNLTELLIYGGLAVLFTPLFNLFSGIILLVLISLYDAYAVWRSKHMVKLAQSQTKARLFAGLLIPYQLEKLAPELKKKAEKKAEITLVKSKKSSTKVRTAILGGGDLGFPLIFAGVILKEIGLWQSLVIPFFAALGLAFLLFNSHEQKFYPAMPFISAGCFIGLGFVWLLGMVISFY